MALEEGTPCPHCPASSRRTYKSLPMHVYQRHPEKAGLSVVLSYTDPFHRPQVTTVLKTQLSKDDDLWVWRCPGHYCDNYFTKKGDLTVCRPCVYNLNAGLRRFIVFRTIGARYTRDQKYRLASGNGGKSNVCRLKKMNLTTMTTRQTMSTIQAPDKQRRNVPYKRRRFPWPRVR